MSQVKGFTLLEVMVALLVLQVGVLGWLAARVLVARALARGSYAEAAASVAGRRLERVRTAGCAAPRDSGDVEYRGAAPIDSLGWRFVASGDERWDVVLRSTHRTELNRWRTDSAETEISCAG